MAITFKLNEIETNLPEFGGKKSYESIEVVPSTLMRTPSRGYSKFNDALLKNGVFNIAHSHTASKVDITSLEAVVPSNVGKHFISIVNTLSIPSSEFASGATNKVYLAVTYNDNDTINGLYPKDTLTIICQDVNDAPPANSISVLEVAVNGGGSITSVADDNVIGGIVETGGIDSTEEHTQAEIDALETNA
jgi:hypothetical protein